MASKDQTRSIFNTESEDRSSSPEKINEYIRISGPGTFIMMAALLLVLSAVIIWGLTGTLPVTETVTGVVDASNDCHITCFVDASRFSKDGLMGRQVTIRMADRDIVEGVVEMVSPTMYSEEEAVEAIGNDWLASNLVKTSYSLIVSIKPKKDMSMYEYQLVEASIITEEIRPIMLLMR